MYSLLLLSALFAGGDWHKFPDEPNQLSLWVDGRQVGNWDISEQQFYAKVADKWMPVDPPVEPPEWAVKRCKCSKDCRCRVCKCKEKKSKCCDGCQCAGIIGNYGVMTERLSNEERVSVSGKRATKKEAERAIIQKSSKVPDDSSLLSLTFIGTEDECKTALSDLAQPQFDEFRSHCLVQCYRPSDVMVSAKHWGGPTDGNPVCILETPDGLSLWLEVEYEGVDTIARLAQADPNFDANAVPGPHKSALGGEHVGWIVALGSFLCFGFFVFVVILGIFCLVRLLRR